MLAIAPGTRHVIIGICNDNDVCFFRNIFARESVLTALSV